jgi:ArsR family transcriptional regulator, arsenate/arsenite/antimonite-responsive transcriptional repressor / arsenate reductase (thioredoxin)
VLGWCRLHQTRLEDYGTAVARSRAPRVLKLLAHDLRWGIVKSLAQSDCRVLELSQALRAPLNLTSYHLRQLHAAKVVRGRRSTADGRNIYYSLAYETLRASYHAAGDAIHPHLPASDEVPGEEGAGSGRKRVTVLFLCTHNSARSQMAEAMLRHFGGSRVAAFSAGSEPQPVHPMALRVLANLGIDAGGLRSKHLSEFEGRQFDFIATVCDRVREVCPTFPGDPHLTHWSIPDPAAVNGNEMTRLRAFEDVAQQLLARIRYLLIMVERAAQS